MKPRGIAAKGRRPKTARQGRRSPLRRFIRGVAKHQSTRLDDDIEAQLAKR